MSEALAELGPDVPEETNHNWAVLPRLVFIHAAVWIQDCFKGKYFVFNPSCVLPMRFVLVLVRKCSRVWTPRGPDDKKSFARINPVDVDTVFEWLDG